MKIVLYIFDWIIKRWSLSKGTGEKWELISQAITIRKEIQKLTKML